jgi:hypothetical protein
VTHPSRYLRQGQATFEGVAPPPVKPPTQRARDEAFRRDRDNRRRAVDAARTAFVRAAIEAGELTRGEMLKTLEDGIDVPGYGRYGGRRAEISHYVEWALEAWRKRTGAKAYRPSRKPESAEQRRERLLADAKAAAA